MKKIIKGILIVLLVLVILAAAVFVYIWFFAKKPPLNDQNFITDPAGISYLAVEVDGVTHAVVTDDEGNRYAAKILEDGSIGPTVTNVNELVQHEALPTNYTGDPVNESTDASEFTGKADVVTEPEPSSAPVESTTKPPKPTAEVKPVYRVERYQKLFESGQYLIEFTTSDESLGTEPITAAVKNGNLLMIAQYQGYNLKVLYRAADDTTYIIIDSIKKFLKMPEGLMGDEFNMTDLTSGFSAKADDSVQIQTSQVTIGEKTLNCETVTSKDGSVTSYYFDGDTLVRMDTRNEDGTVDSTYISKLTSDVPDSTFDIPSNYAYLPIPLEALIH